MLDKMIGVSPPQAGAAHDAKPANGKELRESSESKAKYRSDFESALKKKMAKHKEESRADKKEKKSSGGIKKKMTDVDDKMVSNNMASIENVIEIPDSKTEIPAEIKVDTTLAKKTNLVPQPGLETLSFDEELQPSAEPELSLPPMPVAAEIPEPKLQMEMPPVETAEIPQAQVQPPIQAPAMAPEKIQSMQDLESELGAAVDFKPSLETLKSNKDVTEKLKHFDLEKNTSPEKAQSFEKNILAQLQKENAFNPDQSSDRKDGDFGQKDEREGIKDLKGEPQDNQLHQAAGQTHGTFKAHVAAAANGAGQEQSLGSKLEENREANINEIMNQAQYLVKKGGGEMTVKMTPEGLGEVQLRVLLQDGKLNVEIQTQDKHVKKLVEDSLSELKSGLAAHRLSLEHVKVDTVNATNADNNTQFQSNLNHGGSDSRAQDFWKDVQSNLNQQSGRKSQGEERSDQPRTTAMSSVSKAANGPLRTYGGTKGATINRVA